MTGTDETKQTRREFLKKTGTAALGMTLGARIPGMASVERDSNESAPRKPNVIVVFADQLRSQALGCYGNRQVPTPNFDKLAAGGARFTNAISTYPLCSPFRAMLMTGRYPMSNGVVYNNYPIWDGQPTIARALKAQGYETGYIGKWHLAGKGNYPVPPERRQGFDYWVPRKPLFIKASDDPDAPTLWEPDVQTDLAIRYVQEHRDKPFCLFMSWYPPHDPYIAPEPYMQRFPKSEIEFRPNVAESEIVREQLAKHNTGLTLKAAEKRTSWRKRVDTDDGIRKMISGYYAATAGLDDCMGRLTKALEKAGIAEDTILVFTSDHGDMLGSHRMGSKQEPFEEAISIPFLLRYPRRVPAGITTDALLSPMDIMPTLLGLVGVPCPDAVEGLNLAEAATGKRSDQQDALLIMKMLPGGNPWIVNAATEWRGVRTKTHTYARLQDGGPWILFDNENDPYQMKNLIDDPAHKNLRDDMEARLKLLLQKARDPFDTEAIKEYIGQKGKDEPRGSSRAAGDD